MSEIKVIADGGVVIGVETLQQDGITHRRIVIPGSFVQGEWVSTDLSGEPEEVGDLATELWTEEAVEDFKQRIYEPPHIPTQADYAAAIQQQIDAVAQSRQYDNGATLAGYATDPNPDYANDASIFISWRSSVWGYANAQLALVVSGQRSQPSISDLLSELPQLVWPS